MSLNELRRNICSTSSITKNVYKSFHTKQIKKMKNQKNGYSDGGYGWVIVVSAFAIGFIVDGLMFSFGILMVELLTQFNEERADTALIISITMGMSQLIGPFTGALCDKFGHRIVVMLGSVVASSGFFLSAFANGVPYMSLSYGILGGLGFGLMYLPGKICVMQHFEERRSLAAGISACGSGFGNFSFTHLSRYLIDYYGWRGTLLLEAAIILHGIVCGLLLVNPTRKTSKQIEPMSASKKSSIPKGVRTNTVTEYSHCDNGGIVEDTNTILESKKFKDNLKDARGCFTNFFQGMFSVSLLKDKTCWLFLLSTAMFQLAFTIPINLLPDQGNEAGMTKEETSWLISTIGISNIVGRVCVGWLGDKRFINRMVLLDVILLLISLATGLSFLLGTFELKLIYTCLFGLFTGSYITLSPVVLVDIFGMELISKTFGLFMASTGISALISTPFAGWLFDKTGKYDLTFVVAGIEFMLSAFCLLGLQLLLKRRSHTKRMTSSTDGMDRAWVPDAEL